MGVEAVAHTMNLSPDTLIDEVEPFLLRTELVVRTPRPQTHARRVRALGHQPGRRTRRSGPEISFSVVGSSLLSIEDFHRKTHIMSLHSAAFREPGFGLAIASLLIVVGGVLFRFPPSSNSTTLRSARPVVRWEWPWPFFSEELEPRWWR